MSAVVKNNHLKFNGKNYFRVGSEDVSLGACGEKKSPLTQGNYLEVQDRIPTLKLQVRDAVEIDIDMTASTKNDILANIDVNGVFQGSAGTAYSDLKTGKLKLVKLSIDNEELKQAANDSPKILDELIRYGNDARISNQVFVVLENSLAETVTHATGFTVTAESGNLKLTVSGGNGSTTTTSFVVSPNMTFAYGLVKLDWDAHQDKNKSKIVRLTDDQWGPV